MRDVRALALTLCALVASCSSGGGDGETVPDRGRDAVSGDSSGGGEDADGTGEDAADQADSPDAGDDVPAECMAGAAECVNRTTARDCGVLGHWTTRPCGPGETCTGGVCSLDASTCTEGETICLDSTTPAACVPGVEWAPMEPCGAGSACSGGRCIATECARAADTRSYLGCSYVATDLPNLGFTFSGTPEAPLGIVIANANDTVTHVTLRDAMGDLAPVVVERSIPPPFIAASQYTAVTVRTEIRDRNGDAVDAGMTHIEDVAIPARGMAVLLVAHHEVRTETGVVPNAWFVETDQPVAAYQFSPYCCNYSFTNDASLLLPIATLGEEYRYIGVPSWGQLLSGEERPSGDSAVMTIIAVEDSTYVRIEMPAGVDVIADRGRRVTRTGDVWEATLDRGEVLHLFAGPAVLRGSDLPVGPDMSGAHIQADRPISVFSGHDCAFYPQDMEACDHLEEQLFPVDTWGRDYTLAPAKFRATNPSIARETTYWKIIARDNGTQVTFSVPFNDLQPYAPGFEGVPDCAELLTGASSLQLDAGEHCEFGTRAGVGVTASSPIAVMGVISGQASTGILSGLVFNAHAGDPAVFLLPPAQQYRDSYTFLTPSTYFNDYVTIIASRGSTITLDGEIVNLDMATDVLGTSDVFTHVRIEDGPHEIRGSPPFGILVHAYDDYVSYAFTGGLNLTKDSER